MIRYGIGGRSAGFLLLLAATIFLQFISGVRYRLNQGIVREPWRGSGSTVAVGAGLGDDSLTPKNGTRTETPSKSKGKTGQTVLIVLLGIGGLSAVGFVLFKYWQKKKREEQHARLLKLFEEDDELEVELGLRD